MNNQRIIIVDALRGFALFLIILVHYIEHFELFAQPQVRWFFSAATDTKVFETIMFIVGGKAYSIFALMFGFSFFIQLNRAEQRGTDFRLTFLWRLVILLVIGFLHSLVYKGDILHIYAMMGILLVPFYKLKVKHLIFVASFFLLQVPTIIQTIWAFADTSFNITPTFGWGIWGEADQVFSTGSFKDVVAFNFWTGRTTAWGWTFYTNRYLQLFGLFIVGLILGKTGFFSKLKEHKALVIKFALITPLIVATFLFLNAKVQASELTGMQKNLSGNLLRMYGNIAFTIFYCSILILIHLKLKSSRIINSFAVYGKMSLSNYVIQAVFGVVFFYEFGLGMWRYMGATWSLIMGVLFYILQVEFSKFWIKRYYYGPLEWLWRALTLFDFSIKLKRDK